MSEDVEIKDPKAVLEALERAKADAKKFREAFEDLEKKWADAEQERTEIDARIAEYEAGEARWKEMAKLFGVKSSLKHLDADRVLKFIDLDAIDFDDNDSLVGLDDQINKVREDLPELFDDKKRVGAGADAFASGDAPRQMTGTEMQVARIFGR